MTEEEAVTIAVNTLEGNLSGIFLPPAAVFYKRRHMALGKNRSGWVVSFRLDVPKGFEPNLLHIEVYEDDGTAYIPRLL